MNGLVATCQMTPGKSMLGNVLCSWLFSIFPHGCCMIIAPTKRRVSHTLMVMCMPVSSGTDTHSRNLSGSIIFGQEWMQECEHGRLRSYRRSHLRTASAAVVSHTLVPGMFRILHTCTNYFD